MEKAKSGDLVRVEYKGILEDGSVFDSSEGSDLLEFKLGGGMVLPGFEQIVDGLSLGESGSTKIPAQEAYGQRNEEWIFPVPKDQIPSDFNLEVGKSFVMKKEDGMEAQVLIKEIKDDEVILDGNHPLAGFDLTFEIKLVEIVK
jgi:peptidylprolyl isomerase